MRMRLTGFAIALLLVAECCHGQAPEGKGPKGKGLSKDGVPVLPPFAVEKLRLTPEQQRAVADLEREIRDKLAKILTAEQLRTLREMRPPGKGDGKGPPDKGAQSNDAPTKKQPPTPETIDRPQLPDAQIAWFPQWKTGLAEAQRSGRPILLASAAPHCGGVSGVW